MWQENMSGQSRRNMSKEKIDVLETKSKIKISGTFIGITVNLRMVIILALIQ